METAKVKKTVVAFVASLFAVLVLLCMYGCSAGQAAQEYSVGETAETDVVEFTLDRAELTLALENTLTTDSAQYAKTGVIDDSYFMPKEYDAADGAKNPFVAEKGHTLVSVTFTAKNLDRTSLELCDSTPERFIEVDYEGQIYTNDRTLYHEGNEIEVIYGAENSNGQGWKDYTVSNILLSSGETASYKALINIPVEIEDLQSSFKVTFNLPTSDGKTEPFTYSINA